jgi:hypothetical protein
MILKFKVKRQNVTRNELIISELRVQKAPEGQNIGNKQSISFSAPEGRNIVSYSKKTPLLRPSGAKNTEG